MEVPLRPGGVEDGLRRPLHGHAVAAVLFVHRRHHLHVCVERLLVDPRLLVLRGPTRDPHRGPGPQQRHLHRVARGLVGVRVVRRARAEEAHLHGVAEARVGVQINRSITGRQFAVVEVHRRAREAPLVDRHLVFGEGARLVRADDACGAERLHGGELAHEGVALGHAPHPTGQRDGGHDGQPLGDGRHGQGDPGLDHQDPLFSGQNADCRHGDDDDHRDVDELAPEFGQPLLQLKVQVERAVEKATAGTAGAVLGGRLLGRFLHPRVRGKSQIVVRPRHDEFVAIHDGPRAFALLNRPKVWIQIRFLHFGVVARRIEEAVTLLKERRFLLRGPRRFRVISPGGVAGTMVIRCRHKGRNAMRGGRTRRAKKNTARRVPRSRLFSASKLRRAVSQKGNTRRQTMRFSFRQVRVFAPNAEQGSIGTSLGRRVSPEFRPEGLPGPPGMEFWDSFTYDPLFSHLVPASSHIGLSTIFTSIRSARERGAPPLPETRIQALPAPLLGSPHVESTHCAPRSGARPEQDRPPHRMLTGAR